MEQIEQRSIKMDKEVVSDMNELKWETPTNEDLIWVSLFYFAFLLTYFIIVIIFSDMGAGFLLIIGVILFFSVVIAGVLNIDLPWQWGVVFIGGLFFVIFFGLYDEVGLINSIIIMLFFYAMFFSLLFGIGFCVKKTTRTLKFQYQGGFSETFSDKLIIRIEEWLGSNNIHFRKEFHEVYKRYNFQIEPLNGQEITLIIDKDIKGDEEFHELTLTTTRKWGISSLVNYEEDLLDIVLSMIRG
jgi:hypothetical protein